MTESQKQQILSFRRQGIGYLKIAQELGISQNTVKSYCRRNNLTKPVEITEIPKQTEKQSISVCSAVWQCRRTAKES